MAATRKQRGCGLCSSIALGVLILAASSRGAADASSGDPRAAAGLFAVLSDAVKASNDIYLAERIESFSEAEFHRRIDAWWQDYTRDAATQHTWSRLAGQPAADDVDLLSLLDRSSFFRTAGRLRDELRQRRENGSATTDLVRCERFAAAVVRDFVRRGIVRSYQLRPTMWYEPVWVLTQRNGYCVDYADWFYWLATMCGVRADVALVSTSSAVDFPDHVLNLVRYADASIEIVEPQKESGYDDLAWLLVLAQTNGQWKMERVTPDELLSRPAAAVRGLGAYAIESLRYQERARKTLACVHRCTIDPTFPDRRAKYAAAIKKATTAWSQFSEYADVTSAGRVNYEVPILLRLAELHRTNGRADLADKLAASAAASIRAFAAESQPVPLRIDALFVLARLQEQHAEQLADENAVLEQLDAAEATLRLAESLGAASRQKYLRQNLDLRLARIYAARSRIVGSGAAERRVVAKGTPADEQALAYAERAVAAHRQLRERLDEQLRAGPSLRGFGLFQKRNFRRATDVYLRESYLALGKAHEARALTLLAAADQTAPGGASPAQPESLVQARQHLERSLACFAVRTQTNLKSDEPDWPQLHDARIHLARVAVALGQYDEAAQQVGVARAIEQHLADAFPDPARQDRWRRHVASLDALLADSYTQAARYRDAVNVCLRLSGQPGMDEASVQRRLGWLYDRLAATTEDPAERSRWQASARQAYQRAGRGPE